MPVTVLKHFAKIQCTAIFVEKTLWGTHLISKRYELSYNYFQPKEAFTIQVDMFAGKKDKHSDFWNGDKFSFSYLFTNFACQTSKKQITIFSSAQTHPRRYMKTAFNVNLQGMSGIIHQIFKFSPNTFCITHGITVIMTKLCLLFKPYAIVW